MRNEIANFRNYLARITYMDDESFENAMDSFKVESLTRGEFLVQEGRIFNKVVYINEGLFRIFYLKEGVEINTCFCKENSVTTSFNSFINNIPSTENIQALENSVIVTLSSENLKKLQDQFPQWQMVSRLLTEKECLRLSDRNNFLSFETALDKYKQLLQTQPDLLQRVSVQHLASYIGVSRETLSRIRAQIG